MTALPPHLFCFGLGYSARTLARSLRAEGWRIAGTCREAEAADGLRAEGFAVFPFDRTHPLPKAALAGATHILVSIPPEPEGDPVLARHAADIVACEGLSWLGYLSTTAVYGDCGGAWVDENAPRRGRSARARRRAAAEEAWLALWRESAVPVHIFRLAAIYGPGRSPFEALRAGSARRIAKPGQVFCRIHVEDLAAVLSASMAQPHPGAIYNVADDEPAPQEAVVAYAASLLGISPPPLQPFEKAALSPLLRSFFEDNRRVRNNRLKNELGIRLSFPDYRSGLEAILRLASASCRTPRPRSSSQ